MVDGELEVLVRVMAARKGQPHKNNEAVMCYSHGQAKSTNKNKVFRGCPKTIGIDCK